MQIVWKNQAQDMPVLKENKGVTYISFPKLANTGIVKQGFSTRLGGVSTGDFSTMNLSYKRGDHKEAVTENFRRISGALSIPFARIVCSAQTHTVNIRQVYEEDAGNGVSKEQRFRDIDGLITNVPKLPLATFYADCVPLYFVDPEHRAIGLAHSGWRGTKDKMGKAMIEAMGQAFHTRPDRVISAIGPSICQSCYEVSEDVITAFKGQFDESLYEKLFYMKKNGKYQLNLWEANRQVLLEAGLKPENISMPGICTACNEKLLYSHRKSGEKRGNLGAFLMLDITK